MEYKVTMYRQRLAFDRIVKRNFSDEQINAPKIEYQE